MLEVQQGDIAKLSLLFQRHNDRVFDYLFSLSRNRELSHDLLQDVFERIMLKKHTYKKEVPFMGWTLRIAKNMLMDHFRKQKMKLVEIADWDKPTESIANEHSDVYLAMQKIKPEYQEVLTLTRYKGMRYQEVAQVIGISETGVKTRVHRAIKDLRDAYMQITTQ